jgi:hypothetical protein
MITGLGLPTYSKKLWFDRGRDGRNKSFEVKTRTRGGRQAMYPPVRSKDELPDDVESYRQLIEGAQDSGAWLQKRAQMKSDQEWQLFSSVYRGGMDTPAGGAPWEDVQSGALMFEDDDDDELAGPHVTTRTQLDQDAERGYGTSFVISSMGSAEDPGVANMSAADARKKKVLQTALRNQLEVTRRRQVRPSADSVLGRLGESQVGRNYPARASSRPGMARSSRPGTCTKMELQSSWSTAKQSPSMMNAEAMTAHNSSFPLLQVMARPMTRERREV